MGARREFTSYEIAAAADVPVYRARRFWRALGLANPEEGAAEFTAADGDALRSLLLLISDGILDESHALHITRSLGGSTARVARAFVEAMLDPLPPDADGAERKFAVGTEELIRALSDMESLLVYSWRRQVTAALPVLQRRGPRSSIAVGFADLVSFTHLSRQLSDGELTSLVTRFEERAGNLITAYGGRIVKSIGDEVFFAADSPSVAATIAHRIAENVKRRRIPGIRIGVEYGPVITHGGDLFGDTVNLASRLTAMAAPNQIVVGPSMMAALATVAGFEIHPLPVTDVKGFGSMTPGVLKGVRPLTGPDSTALT
ncbi:adenylate/guanylate cyclase domain-containing protein [Mycobacterium paraintracellulare]|uniref:adenylate/guanylate cyclase domain-containing protein n=1 Tax=Mycobacterium paraintracellulare TaxID=1138383 RepID=UPI001F26314C|nr:adenylate/guanylate cyclase domain-containing protein [Mycobacterium paraintracellulare]